MNVSDLSDSQLFDAYNEVCQDLDECDFGSFEYDCLNSDLEALSMEMDKRKMDFDNGKRV